MEELTKFLEVSTIHGLSHIASDKKLSRLFWVFIVIGGFTGASIIIFESFSNWKENPISTTVETLPISELTFPKVTLCPPKDSFLNHNQDLLQAEKVMLNVESRRKLYEFALNVIHEEFHNELMTKLGKIEDSDRFYNWYYGLTQINYPTLKIDSSSSRKYYLWYDFQTSATSGNISTKFLGKKFDAEKVDGYISYTITFFIPISSIVDNRTLYLNIEKVTMPEFGDNDQMILFWNGGQPQYLDADLKQFDISGQANTFYIRYKRKVPSEDISNLDLITMPGFRLSWNYDMEMQPSTEYQDYTLTKEFVRYENDLHINIYFLHPVALETSSTNNKQSYDSLIVTV